MNKTKIDFEEIRSIRNEIRVLLSKHVHVLEVYRAPTFGYVHRYDETKSSGDVPATKDDPSKASTATCIESIMERGELISAAGDTHKLLDWLLLGTDKGSAGLPDGNAFTTAFMLDAALQLHDYETTRIKGEIDRCAPTDTTKRDELKKQLDAFALTPAQAKLRESAIRRLEAGILSDHNDGAAATPPGGSVSRAERGAANIEPYPPTAFLTQLVIRTLAHAGSANEEVSKAARKWARAAMEHEIALLSASDNLADPYALAYAAITFASLSKESRLTPQEKRVLTLAVDRVFASQNADGSWPRSRPLFHYANVGNAYCFEYEMLTQLLLCQHLSDDIERHVPRLINAVKYLDRTRYDLELGNGETGAAWASGHHPQIRGPESWSTAAVYHFLHLIERFLSRMLRDDLFARLKGDPRPLTAKAVPLADFGSTMLDSKLHLDGADQSLKATIRQRFLAPLTLEAASVGRGRAFPSRVMMSMLMFGPPGTSKTTLAKDIAKALGWPLLEVDPSHILLDGWDRVHATAIKLLDDLAEIDCAVVLLDEFDELVRTRGAGNVGEGEGGDKGEPISRFFTTAMLPKLIKLNKERRIVLLMATNFVDQFDDAIAREGRFDARIQVLPPSSEAKLSDTRFANIKRLETIKDLEFRSELEHLTFAETVRFNDELAGVSTKDAASKVIEKLKDKATLLKDGGKWKADCETQRRWIRI
jgi:hypothetical protein